MQICVPQHEKGRRLDHFLADKLSHLSRARIQHLIRDGHILLNDDRTKSGEKIHAGDVVSIHEPSPTPGSAGPEAIALNILFEDEDIIVLNKPAGLVVHPAAGNWRGTLVNALLHHCQSLSGIGGEQRPGIVHRLDKHTSGCMVVAKNDGAHLSLSRQFASRAVVKTYLAIVSGHPRKKSGTIESSIGRHPVYRKKMAVLARGRAAKTDYRVLEELPGASLVECRPHTGRTHQIRVHLKQIGHPIVGDTLYGGKSTAERHLLHAWKLAFRHPRTDAPMQFVSPMPDDFFQAGVCPL